MGKNPMIVKPSISQIRGSKAPIRNNLFSDSEDSRVKNKVQNNDMHETNSGWDIKEDTDKKLKYHIDLKDHQLPNPVDWFSVSNKRDSNLPYSGKKELSTSISNAEIITKPNIFALKNCSGRKSKRPVSAYVAANQRRNNLVSYYF